MPFPGEWPLTESCKKAPPPPQPENWWLYSGTTSMPSTILETHNMFCTTEKSTPESLWLFYRPFPHWGEGWTATGRPKFQNVEKAHSLQLTGTLSRRRFPQSLSPQGPSTLQRRAWLLTFLTLFWRSCTKSFLRLCRVCSSLATVSSSPFRSCLACSRRDICVDSSDSLAVFSTSSAFSFS